MSWIVFTTIVLAVASGSCACSEAAATPVLAPDSGHVCISGTSDKSGATGLEASVLTPWLAAPAGLTVPRRKVTLHSIDKADNALILRSRTILTRFSGNSPPA